MLEKHFSIFLWVDPLSYTTWYKLPRKLIPVWIETLFHHWWKPWWMFVWFCTEVLMWSWSSSPSVRQRRRDRSRIHRSLWPSHPASAYPRCLHITQQRTRKGKQRKRERVKPKLPKATWSLQDVRARVGPQLQAPPVTTTTPHTEGMRRGGGRVSFWTELRDTGVQGWDTNTHIGC